MLLSNRSKSSALSVLLVTDPVDLWVSSDGLVIWVDDDNLIVFISSILSNPVRVKHSKVGAVFTDSDLSDGLKWSGGLDLVDSLVNWFTVNDTLLVLSLSSSSSDLTSVSDITLLGFISESSGLIDS